MSEQTKAPRRRKYLDIQPGVRITTKSGDGTDTGTVSRVFYDKGCWQAGIHWDARFSSPGVPAYRPTPLLLSALRRLPVTDERFRQIARQDERTAEPT